MKTRFLIPLLVLLVGCVKPESCILERFQEDGVRSAQAYQSPMSLREIANVYFDLVDGDTITVEAYIYRWKVPEQGNEHRYFLLDYPTRGAHHDSVSWDIPQNQRMYDSIMQGRGNISCVFLSNLTLEVDQMPELPRYLFERDEAYRCTVTGLVRFIEEQSRGYSTDGPCGEEMKLSVISPLDSILLTIE